MSKSFKNPMRPTTLARGNHGPIRLSIWQYILLGGPSHTFACYSEMIFKHRENYIDIKWLCEEDQESFFNNKPLPLENYGPMSDDLEGGSLENIFSNAYPESVSIKPTIISILSLFFLIIQITTAILCSMTFTIESPNNPYVFLLLWILLTIGFFTLFGFSFCYWSLESEYTAYLPLLYVNFFGTTSNVIALTLLMFWSISSSSFPHKIEHEEQPLMYIKYSIICVIYIIMTMGNFTVYFYSILSGYKNYVSQFPIVYKFVKDSKRKKPMSYYTMNEYTTAPAYFPPNINQESGEEDIFYYGPHYVPHDTYLQNPKKKTHLNKVNHPRGHPPPNFNRMRNEQVILNKGNLKMNNKEPFIESKKTTNHIEDNNTDYEEDGINNKDFVPSPFE